MEEEEKRESFNENNDKTYDNFNIKDKEPKHILIYHKDFINCSTVLKDGSFVTGSNDNSIIIYNNKTFKPDLTIKVHKSGVICLVQLSSGYFVSCSYDKTIKIFNNKFKLMQTIVYHSNFANKIIELKTKQLVSCLHEKYIIVYNKVNNEYIKDYSFSTNGRNGPIIQTKNNEICYYEHENTICFYDLIKKNIIKKIHDISATIYTYDSFLMISEDLLLITGKDKISIVNVDSYDLISIIDVPDSGWIKVANCMLNNDMIITGDDSKRIIQWKIYYDILTLFSKKENAHDGWISTLSILGNGLILSGSGDGTAKIW